jgi:hypothetical protein
MSNPQTQIGNKLYMFDPRGDGSGGVVLYFKRHNATGRWHNVPQSNRHEWMACKRAFRAEITRAKAIFALKLIERRPRLGRFLDSAPDPSNL